MEYLYPSDGRLLINLTFYNRQIYYKTYKICIWHICRRENEGENERTRENKRECERESHTQKKM